MQVIHRRFQSAFMPLLITAILCSAVAAQSDDEAKSNGKPEGKPVIVLTGFEPFGPAKPPNPSWEGIRELHEKEIGGYRIVTHQVPVIWGEPREHLGKLIDEHHPVAIFSFGQGAVGAFAIESVAMNSRAEFPDNSGKTPPEPTITSDGPRQYQSSFPCEQMKNLLSKKGYPVEVSTSAGRYLCEETLYSLEHIRTQNGGSLIVSFCHVPPLGSRVGANGETLVDKTYVQAFVEDYVKAWQEMKTARTDSGQAPRVIAPAGTQCDASADDERSAPTSKSQAADRAVHPEQAAVEELIERYFKSWSEQRMKDYGDCFADDAVIQELNARRDIHTQSKGPFVTTQATYHKMALFKATEIPVKTTITFEAELARAVVYWKLTAGPRKQFGYDHFTLVKQDGEWKIANLVFYGTNDKE